MSTRKQPIPIGSAERLFGALHRRFVDRGYERPDWDRLDPSRWPSDEVELARRAWAARTIAEYRSMIVFGELIARFAEIRLPLEVTCAASRLLSDEARHTELCARMTEVFGGHEREELAPKEVRLSQAGLPAHLFVARWTAAMFCVGESASVAVLRVLARGATDPCVRTVLRTLLRDELLHDKFGWALARLVLPRLTDDEAEWLAADLAFSFAHYDRIHAGAEDPSRTEAAPALGVASTADTGPAFRTRIERDILPSLAKLGIPAYEAWIAREDAVRPG